jgi:hypothetical protein
MNDAKKKSILDKYESWESVPAAIKAWITTDAIKEGKNPVMVRAGYKAAFKRIQNNTTFTIVREDGGYLGGCVSSIPLHHVIKARSEQMLTDKIGRIYEDILEGSNKDSKGYWKAMSLKKENITSLVEDLEAITVDGVELQIISDPEHVEIL